MDLCYTDPAQHLITASYVESTLDGLVRRERFLSLERSAQHQVHDLLKAAFTRLERVDNG